MRSGMSGRLLKVKKEESRTQRMYYMSERSEFEIASSARWSSHALTFYNSSADHFARFTIVQWNLCEKVLIHERPYYYCTG